MATATTNLSTTSTTDLAAALLRVSLGGLFLAHAGLKIFVFTPAGTAAFFASLGLPGALAYVTMTVEVLGGVALILGYRTRIAALVTIPVLLGAIAFVHIHNGFFFNDKNGGWEYPAFWIITLIVQAMLGGGAFSMDANRD